jgi:glutamine amidotransferase
MTVAIVDLGCGNVGSVRVALARLGADTRLTADPGEIAAAERVVLPGVGAAGYAMARIDALGLRGTLTRADRPLLGICLGMQLLFEASEEDETACLGLIPGRVRRLEPAPGRPVPHMGWSRLEVRRGDTILNSSPGPTPPPAANGIKYSVPETMGLADGDFVYFAHGFACDDGPHTIAAADYGRTIPAAVRKDLLFGAQFHPERSSQAGTRFLQAFLSC